MLKLVYHKVRFPLMSTKYFSSAVVPTGVLSQNEMLNMFCYLTYPEGKPDTAPFASTPRRLWENVLVSRHLNGIAKAPDYCHVKGSLDCIGVEVDHECQLLAVGTFVGKGVTNCRVSIFKLEKKNRDLVGASDELVIEIEEISEEPFRVELREPLTMLPGLVYEIEIDQTGPPSKRIKKAKSMVKVNHMELVIGFKWHEAGDASQTSVKKGNIPCIWVRVLSGRLCSRK